MEGSAQRPRCLVTGATGYVGSRLVPELLATGHSVRCLARSRSRLDDFPWAAQVEAVIGDARDPRALNRALAGIDVAYYLIHALRGGSGFERADREAAMLFAAAAKRAGVRRIIYLSGLHPAKGTLSAHLRSRAEVAAILLGSGVPTIVLRAAIIVGSGSASFEMLRHLTERLPVMVSPRWVTTRVQPIAIADVLHYLVGCADLPEELNRPFDIGGPDVLSYLEMMRRYAAVAGLPRRLIIVLPLLSPRLSSLWIGLVTPVPPTLARILIDSMYHEVICQEQDIADHVPVASLLGFDESVRLALRWVRNMKVTDSEAAHTASDPLPTDPPWTGGSLYEDVRERPITVSPKLLWQVVTELPARFRQRPLPMSTLARRTHRLRHPATAARGAAAAGIGGVVTLAGAALGPWRADEVIEGRRLRLRADGRLPGIAWLELGVRSGEVPTVYTQRAAFHPRGLLGHVCWWAARPWVRMFLDGLERGVTRSVSERRPPPDQVRTVSRLAESRPANR